MDDDRGMVMENECVVHKRNLGGRLLLLLIRCFFFFFGGSGDRCFRTMFLVVDGCGVFRGRVWTGGRCYLRLGWRFCGSGGESGSGGFGFGSENCCEAGVGLFWWEYVFLAAIESNVSGRKNVQCWWASLWYGDSGMFLKIAFIFWTVVVWER